MDMLPGGIDVFYIDESHDRHIYVVTALAVPLIRPREGGMRIAWADQFRAFKEWRKAIAQHVQIPTSKELHGVKLASGRGNFFKGRHNFSKAKASSVYRQIMQSFEMIPDAVVMSTSASRGDSIYGNERLENALHKLFQRMRLQCVARDTNAIVFFDEGHPEYRKLYRKAQVYLQTGSRLGAWNNGRSTQNLPLDMFFKDGNEKSSKHCFFTQAADLVAYAAFLKRKHEVGELTDWQKAYNLGTLYDELPAANRNLRVQGRAPRDGIVR